jgi:hypothetical protein
LSYICITTLILREEHRLRVFENRALRRIFGPKRDEIIVGRRILYNEERHNLYSSPNIIRIIKTMRMRKTRHRACSTHGGEEERIQGSGGKSRR